jgi:acyl-CoA thioesterase I
MMIRKYKRPISIIMVILTLLQSYTVFPANNKTKRKIVVCLGDSITKADVSVNYIKTLRKNTGSKFRFYNRGVNGDLAWNVLQRLDEIIALKPDFITILIGTNDVLATFSPAKSKRYIKHKKLPEAASREWYTENLKTIIAVLKSKTHAKIALLSLPLLTEDKDHVMYKRSIEYSLIIKDLAAENGLTYLALNEQQQKFYEGNESRPKTVFSESDSFSIGVVVRHFLLCRRWDALSRKYGLQLTTDHIHQNHSGAEMISGLIEGFLKNNE